MGIPIPKATLAIRPLQWCTSYPERGMHRSCTETTEESAIEEGCRFADSFSNQSGRIAHLYALVVVQQRGKCASEIQDALQVLLSHTKEKDDNCRPRDSSSCYFQKRMASILLMVALLPSAQGNPISLHQSSRMLRGLQALWISELM